MSLKNVWFTDGSWFFLDGIAQKNKTFYWALSKDAFKPTICQKYPIKIHVWAGVSVSGLIGPYFFYKDGSNITVNTESVHVPGLYSLVLKLRNKFSTAILMQDGATPHTALSTKTFLRQQFKDRIIGKHFTKEWPAQSPDLTPADNYLWPQLKSTMYQGHWTAALKKYTKFEACNNTLHK